MKKGISPIVAVVLLIAIAVIAAVGLYFWVGGLATKQPTPNPPATISAYAVHCADPNNSNDNTTIMIANTSPPGTTVNITNLKDSLGHNFTNSSKPTAGNDWNCTNVNGGSTLDSGEQTSCIISGSEYKSGDGTISIYGNKIASATVTC